MNSEEYKKNKIEQTTTKKEISFFKKIEKKFQIKNENFKNKKTEKILIIDSVRSVLNVGSIFRTSDAIGIDKIFLTGFSPTPIDRFGRERKDFQKASLGAKINWEYFENIIDLVQKLKKENYLIISIEQDKKSLDYKKVSEKISSENFEYQKIAVVMGSETLGVNKEILKNSDIIAELPMYGFKNSLNVAVTTGIILYSFFDNNFLE